MPSRSRTKPGSTTRRPKVAGRQQVHAGTATRRPEADPDVLDTVEAPNALEPLAVDDREAATGATAPSTTTPAAPDDAPADDTPERETTPVAATSQPADTDVTIGSPETAEDATTESATPTAEPVAAADIEALSGPATTSAATADTDTADPADTADTGTTGRTTVDTVTGDTATDTVDDPTVTDTAATDTTVTDTTATTGVGRTDTPAGEATDASTHTAAATPTRSRSRKRSGMAPRPEAATAPTRERPARRGPTADDEDAVTATPTRTAKPTRTGGKRTGEPEAASPTGRLARVRTALTRFGRSRALFGVLAAVIVVCLVLSGLAFWQGRQAWTSGPVSNQAVIDVGGTAELVGQTRESIEKIFSYDFTRLDESVDAARTMSTGQFTDRYLSVFDQTIRAPAVQQQLKQTATVVNIGVMTMRDDRAELMALTQFSAQRTSTGQSTNAPGLLRLQMERVDGRWKLAELTPLTAPR